MDYGYILTISIGSVDLSALLTALGIFALPPILLGNQDIALKFIVYYADEDRCGVAEVM